MKETYGPAFARVYNLLWAGFAQQAAPRLLEYYARTPLGQANRTVLDVGCGAGQLALYFLQQGYRVTGLDLSEAMLEQARANTLPYIDNGQARFVQGDAAAFRLNERFGLVVSTYDALNHLSNFDDLCWCFRSVWNGLEEGGAFIFDLNTRAGLYERWNGIAVQETEDAIVITRGIYDGESDHALIRATGCVRMPDGRYERFAETMHNTVFDMRAVRSALLEIGWPRVHFARLADLSAPLTDPEREGRVWVVAER
jgi:SAM-dependent methyltransferase